MHLPSNQQIDAAADGAAAYGPRPLSIASVTVAYNGAAVLRAHLDALRRQSRPLDEIIIVDNASTDDTQRVLAEYPEVRVLRLPENRGIAGGLASGLAQAALEGKHDWVWTFDQDSVPSPDALENLLKVTRQLNTADDKIAILASTCVNQETGKVYPSLCRRGWRFVLHNVSEAAPFAFVDMTISSGSLISREAIEQAGLPREDLFMDFVDYEYCLRLRHLGYRIVVVRDSRLMHIIGAPATVNLFGRKRSWADHAPWREYYMARNEVFTIYKYLPDIRAKAFVLYRLLHHALGILIFGKRKRDCLRMIWRGFLDGRSGRLGIRFLPGGDHDVAANLRDEAGILSTRTAEGRRTT